MIGTMKTVIVLMLCAIFLNAQDVPEMGKVVCYYTDWSVYRAVNKFTPLMINPHLCTHLIYAFLKFDAPNNGLQPFDPGQDINNGGYREFNEAKSLNERLKTLGAIGGWREGSSNFAKIAGSKQRRLMFAENTIKFLRQHGFDGINIDWQFPTFRDGTSEDFENFVLLVKDLKEVFEAEPNITTDSRLLLTMSVPANTEYIQEGFDLPNLQRYVDFMTILCYDYHLSTELFVNHHSPIYPLPSEVNDPIGRLNMNWTVNHILEQGVPREKLILGIPAFGRTYKLEDETQFTIGSQAEGEGAEGISTREVGYKAFYEICSQVKNEEWTVVHINETAMGPFAFKGKDWVGYDDEGSARRKGEYARDNNLGGIMFWTIDDDDFKGICGGKSNPLIRAAREAYFSRPKGVNPPPPQDDTIIVNTPPPGMRTTKDRVEATMPELVQRPQIDITQVNQPNNAERPVGNVDQQSPTTSKPAFTTTQTIKDGGSTYFQTISIWIVNNIFNLGAGNSSEGGYDIDVSY